LDVFTIIAEGQTRAQAVARKSGADERGMSMLLNALTAMELLVKTGDNYAAVPSAERLLSKHSPQYIGYMIMHHHHLVESWSQLDQAVRTGKAVRTRPSFFDDESHRENFLMGMFNMAMGIAPGLTRQISLSGRRRLLDLGGGPGTYAIHFCMNNSDLSATIYDLPATRPFAEKTVEKFGMKNRVVFADGNYLEDPIEGKYDAVWMSHILHGEGPGDCQKIIWKAVRATEPGGMIMVHDFLLKDTMDSPLFPALFSLNMLLGTPYGQAYSEKQISLMLMEAGVKDIRRLDFKGPNDSGIIAGTVDGD
jgi:predicted O-methyltransferase YrrM